MVIIFVLRYNLIKHFPNGSCWSNIGIYLPVNQIKQNGHWDADATKSARVYGDLYVAEMETTKNIHKYKFPNENLYRTERLVCVNNSKVNWYLIFF